MCQRPSARTVAAQTAGLLSGWVFGLHIKHMRKRHGGEGGIRTHGTRKGSTVFETAPIDHSGTSPRLGVVWGRM